MSDRILFFFQDLQAAGLEMNWRDVQMYLTWVLAATIFLVPLTGIDRRHEVTQLTYVATASSLAAVQVFVLSGTDKHSFNFVGFVIATLIFVFIATARWMWGANEVEVKRSGEAEKK